MNSGSPLSYVTNIKEKIFKMKNDKIDKLIVKLFSGEISAEEQSQLEEWYSSSGKPPSFTDQLSKEERNELEKKLFNKINNRIRIKERSKRTGFTGNKVNISPSNIPLKIAAAVTAVLLFAALTYYSTRPQSIRYTTSYGEITEVTLPDSSHVIMNGNSTLTMVKNWSPDRPREVYLDGEAIFSVQKSKDHQKFIVHTSDEFNVEVLGTEFNVFARKSKTRVVLNSGAVQLNISKSNISDQVWLAPGDMLEYSGDPFQYVKKQVNVEQYTSWTEGKLLLDKTNFSEIILMLEETYGLNIIVADDQLLDERISGSLSMADVNQLIADLAATLDITARIEEKTVYFIK